MEPISDLSDRIEQATERWQLTFPDGAIAYEATCAWVMPVQQPGGTQAVLKIPFPHFEGEDEAAGLRFWSGDPTAHLLAEDDSGSMLLERCQPGTSLRQSDSQEQDVIVASLLRRLWRVPETGLFRPLSQMIAFWAREIYQGASNWPDAGLVQAGLEALRELSQPRDSDVLLATDLHAGNVLRAEREPWLVIDPKPFVGDRSYDATQHLLNSKDRLRADAQGLIERFSGLLEVDAERVRLWLFARSAAGPRADWTGEEDFALARLLAP